MVCKKEECPICKGKKEDMRHVSVECFYDVQEVVPEATKKIVLQEVDKDGSYWGHTRTYPDGTKDDWKYEQTGQNSSKMWTEQLPQNGGRFLETTIYTVSCCKDCRADFLTLLQSWYKGEHRVDEGYGNIPIRVNGAIKYITEEEWHRMKGDKP